MLDEPELHEALRRHWAFSGRDEDISDDTDDDDAALRFLHPANGSRAWRTSGSGVAGTPPP